MTSALGFQPPVYSDELIAMPVDRCGSADGSRDELHKRLNEVACIWRRNATMTSPIAAPN